MGRGRAKAKQTKVARQLKYSSGGTDLSRLQDELASEHGTMPSSGSGPVGVADEDDDGDTAFDSYDGYADDDEDSVEA